ncbi:MAG: D-glycerate dehydrogenase [Deltaproteobacteria bacterium]|nr:D-glycerate dehydrogenase [Deltaproteobacteria bacterium]
MNSELRERRVFVTRPIAQPALRRLAQVARVELWDDDFPPAHDELLRRLARADAVLSMVSDRFDAATIAALPNLAAISNLAVGVDNVDLEAATRAGIAVGHTPGVLTETTADLAFALLMAAARRVVEGDQFVRAGKWRTWTPKLMLGRDVWGATLGIIGWGAIGQAVARRASGFGMRILYVSRKGPDPGPANLAGAQNVDLGWLLAESDFISIHVPLTEVTRHLIGVHELAAVKSTAIIINTARGPVIDHAALTAALQSGRIAGAALDVTETEPIAMDDPLLKLPNVVITPHIGSASFATRLRMAELAVDNLLDALAGRIPRCCANPNVKLRSVETS